MTNALDFSDARPSGEEMVAAGAPHALAYTGSGKPRPTREYIDSLLASGCSFTFIQESYASRAQEGYQAGISDAHYADAQADGVGYPLEAAIIYCASDGSRASPGPSAAPAIHEYGRGVADATRRPVMAYGNRMAVDAFRAGAGTLCVGTWVPATWDAIPGTDVLVQEPNIPSPIPNTDFNTTYGDWPRWAGDDMPLSDDDIKRITLPLIQWMQNNVTGFGIDDKTPVSNRMVLDPVLALGGAAPAGGITEDEIRAIVREELDRTKLGALRQ